MEEQLTDTESAYERVLLVGVDDGSTEVDFEGSMEELKSLAKACFMEPVGMITQRMESVNNGLYIGTGKVQEVKEAAELLEAEVIVFDDTLTPSQLRNLQKELDLAILDRTTLILDIFETRARTREAKLQVESARLKYLLPRLVGMHKALTRQGGTSGSMSSRGAGEKKLELDRRRIEHRISELSKELEEVSRERRVQRKKRNSSRIPLVALVGYTNAGKSTIMNSLVDKYVKEEEKRVLEKDMLFATLDTTVRRINTGSNKDFLLSDTVGFIHKLPHGLIKAFHSTLEEVEGADLLLQVVDYSDPYYKEQMETTGKTLLELKAGDIPMITVFNKADKCGEKISYPKIVGKDKIYLSAKEDVSIDLLTDMILDRIYEDYEPAEFLIPYEDGRTLSYFMENAHVTDKEYQEKGTLIKVKCHKADRDKYKDYLLAE
ncbi:GTPase HflX [Lachnospiraceae bacterium]|jgi:GTP-binding protein HflX|nr:GTPase HflX [Lachnospiraceae bacterium]